MSQTTAVGSAAANQPASIKSTIMLPTDTLNASIDDFAPRRSNMPDQSYGQLLFWQRSQRNEFQHEALLISNGQRTFGTYKMDETFGVFRIQVQLETCMYNTVQVFNHNVQIRSVSPYSSPARGAYRDAGFHESNDLGGSCRRGHLSG